jgi:hypothetical protein
METSRTSASFDFQNRIVSLRSSSSCLLLHFVFSSLISLSLSVTSFRTQFLRKMRQTQFAFLLCIVRACSTIHSFLENFFVSHSVGPSDLLHPSPLSDLKTFKAFLIYFSKCQSFSAIQSCAPNVAFP